jgi:hypothetical protein
MDEASDTQSRLSALAAKHHELKQAIEEEAGQPAPDDLLIGRMKREKLWVKDEIARLEAEIRRASS